MENLFVIYDKNEIEDRDIATNEQQDWFQWFEKKLEDNVREDENWVVLIAK